MSMRARIWWGVPFPMRTALWSMMVISLHCLAWLWFCLVKAVPQKSWAYAYTDGRVSEYTRYQRVIILWCSKFCRFGVPSCSSTNLQKDLFSNPPPSHSYHRVWQLFWGGYLCWINATRFGENLGKLILSSKLALIPQTSIQRVLLLIILQFYTTCII